MNLVVLMSINMTSVCFNLTSTVPAVMIKEAYGAEF